MSSKLTIDKRRRTYVRLIGQIEDALNRALQEENASRGLTQQEMADILEKSKSFISRKMNGSSNMTLETLADLAFALDRVVEIELRSRRPEPGSNLGAFKFDAASIKPKNERATEAGSSGPKPVKLEPVPA